MAKQIYTKEKIILVDHLDRQIGTAEKIIVHEYGMLHRAFSVFLFRKRNGKLETLLQRRSKQKYHCGGLWTNTCCSHPHVGESMLAAAHKRLKKEMGITAKLTIVGKFHYIAPFKNGLTENEIDTVIIGQYDNENIKFNKKEVDNFKWITVADLKKNIRLYPEKYTPWLKQALTIAEVNVKKGK
jgi:isopentenyl-diphosphate Delta-isomerase